MKITKRVDKDGTIYYKNENGQFHRLNGPAIEYPYGTKEWYINGRLHREDGPAKIWGNGVTEYWLNHIKYSVEDWELEITKLKLKRIKDL